MEYTIRYINFKEPMGIDDFFAKKLAKIEMFSWTNNHIKAEFELNHENEFTVTLILGVPHSNDVVIVEKSSDLNTAINNAIGKMKISLVKIKEKRTQK